MQPVWDAPTRLFHWLLTILVGFSWWSAEYHHLDWHVWSGCAILTLLIFRLLWGVAGSSTARFADFVRGPRALRDHLSGRWSGLGHNPLGALSVLALLAALGIQVGLGLFSEDVDGLYLGPLSRLVNPDTSDQIAGIHEAWFNVLLGLIALHVAAILFFHWRGKNLVGPMITGRTRLDPEAEPMRPAKYWVALICLAVAIGITRWVIAGAPPF